MPAHRVAQGNVYLQGDGSATIIDCSDYGDRLRLKTLVVTFSLVLVSYSVEVTDGTTTIFQWEAKAGKLKQPPCLNFPDGYDWGAGNDIILKIEAPPTKGGPAIFVYAIAVAEARGET